MFIGHIGIGFGAKTAAPKVSLGTLLLAALFLDLLWPALLLLGVERVSIVPGITAVSPLDFEHYPWSHSLLAVLAWAALVGGAYYALRRDFRAAAIIGVAVASHWALDALVHRSDLPLYPGATQFVGLNLWSSFIPSVALEVGLLALGLGLYLRSTEAADGVGRWALWGLVALLLAIYAANLLGPPPPSVEAIAWTGHAQWLFVIWGYWIDAHRRAPLLR